MSERDFAKDLIDRIPESRLFYVIAYLQGAAVPDETPGAETLAAFEELDSGGGHRSTGSTRQLFSELLAGGPVPEKGSVSRSRDGGTRQVTDRDP